MQIKTSEWFAVRVKGRAEDSVSRILMYKGYTTYVPRSSGDVDPKSRCRPLLPGYVLCSSGGDIHGLVLTTPFVLSIVAFGGAAAPIPDAEIERLRAIERSGFPAYSWPAPPEGAPVRIMAGPLKGIEGRFLRSVGRNHLLVSVTMLQRTVSVELDAEFIRSGFAAAVPAAVQ